MQKYIYEKSRTLVRHFPVTQKKKKKTRGRLFLLKKTILGKKIFFEIFLGYWYSWVKKYIHMGAVKKMIFWGGRLIIHDIYIYGKIRKGGGVKSVISLL